MDFISQRERLDGTVSFCVQIRKKVGGNSLKSSRTFHTLEEARTWRDNTLAEIQLGLFEPAQKSCAKTTIRICDVISRRLSEGRELQSSATAELKRLAKHPKCKVPLEQLSLEWFIDFAKELGANAKPQTVASSMALLVSALKWAHKRGTDLPLDVVLNSMAILWEDEILARSEERTRRPSQNEMNAIFEAALANKRQKMPVITVAIFAIYSARRINEICRLRWEDLRVGQGEILVRAMKHPRQKKKNDVWVELSAEALEIIISMPRISEFIFPYKSDSISAAFRRHRDRCMIEDLRFHDLRHDAISRFYEMGETDYFVMRKSGHKSRQSLDRYVNVVRVGDKYKNWHWLQWVLDNNRKTGIPR